MNQLCATPKTKILIGPAAGLLLLLLCAGFTIAQESANPDRETTSGVTFSRMAVSQVRTNVLKWLKSTSADAAALEAENTRWNDDQRLAALSGEEILDLVIESFAAADPATKKLLEESYGGALIEGIIFDGIRDDPFFRRQVQLFRGRWLVQHRFYDEAAPLLATLDPDHVVDPAGLLFYRAVCQSELLQNKEALDSISLLLNNTLDVPDRFRIVAELLRDDLNQRKDKGLDKVAQLMKDVERRLDLGRSGEKTQGQEDAVIRAFDKMLEEMEKQQQQGGGGGNGSQQNQSGTQGASRSEIKGAPAEGKADRKEVTETGKWGMMDKQAEAKARELIRQKFPPNFLDQIGRYTRKLAEKQK